MTLRQENKSLYWAWKAIKQRCSNPKCRAYKNYGARGITFCKEWDKFEGFYEWAVSSGYEKGKDIDRIDNDGNYTPDNCRWATRRENVNNRRSTIRLTVNGETKSASEWEEYAGLTNGVVGSWHYVHGKEYAEGRIKDALENGYKPKNYSYGHTKAVRHIDSGKVFDSVRDAAQYFDIPKSTLAGALCYRNGITSKGRFVYEIIS